MIEFTKHVGNIQPPETIGKIVVYRCVDGITCLPHKADELNWKTRETNSQGKQEKPTPTFGKIDSYRVIH